METAVRQCETCGASFDQPGRGAPKRYCSMKCRPSSKTIAVRMPAAVAMAVHRAVERKRAKMTDDEFDELFDGARERQEDLYLNTGRVVSLESLAE